ncbi:MAG: hypothetical protein ACKV2Q_15905 [Planctomycetaceae bacterium]
MIPTLADASGYMIPTFSTGSGERGYKCNVGCRLAFAFLCLFALLAANSAFAQAPQGAAPPVDPNPDLPARPTIILPFEDAKDPLAAERVYLPHAKFVELWNGAHPESRVAPLSPQEGLVAEALIVVAPNKKVDGVDATAKVTARITLFSFRKHQIVLPVPLRLASLSEAKLDDAPAALIVRDEGGAPVAAAPNGAAGSGDPRRARLHVVIDKPGLHVLDLTAEVPVNQQGPAGQLVIGVDPLPSGKLLFLPPMEEVTFRVNGASNAFRMRNGAVGFAGEKKGEGEGEKRNYFEVPISSGGDIRLAWQPKQAAGAVDAIVQSDSATAVRVEDAGVRIESSWLFKVPRGAINDVSFSLPKELKVRSISGPDVGGWELGENVDGRVLRVFLRRAVGDQTSLAFELFLETRVADEPVTIKLPAFAPLAVTRDFGNVGLFAAPQFTLKNIATKGLTQINVNKFGEGASGEARTASPPLSAFRYTARPFEVSFSAQRRAPESTGFAEHALVVERRKVRMSSRLRWELAGALRSSVSVQLPKVQLPEKWLTVDVDATALQDWHIDPVTNVLTVEFTEPRIGAVEVVLQGNVTKEPEDAIAEVSVPTPLELSKLVTQAAVWFDPAYQATIGSSNTWKTSDPEHCSEELRNKLSRPAKFVFTSNAVVPEILAFDVGRAVPKLSADAVSLVTVSDTAVDYSLALQWKISDAASDTFTFTTPDWLAGKLDFQGAGIRQTSFESAGEGSGRTRWTVTLQDPVGSRYFLLATATLPPPAEKREVTAPTITFQRAVAIDGDAADPPAAAPPADGQEASPFAPLDTQRQYVVVINISSNQLDQVGEVGEAVQRDELPIVVDQRLVDQATAVLRVRGEPPKWELKSYAAQAGAPASVNLADLTTVLAADGTWRMQCVYTIKNRSRQFLALQLPEKSQALSVFVAGQPSRLVELKRSPKSPIEDPKSKIENPQTYQLIALPKTSEADLSIEVKLVLSGRLSSGPLRRGLRFWSQEIELPTPSVVSLSDDKEFGIPVARTLWAVHVPKDWTAKPLNDPLKNNLTDQAADTVAVAYQSVLLQEGNDLMRVVEGSNYRSSQRMQASNNLKQLRGKLQQERGANSLAPQSEEGRKLAAAVQDFEAKQQDLDRRIVIDNRDGTTNFYVAKDQQQAAKANTAQAQGGPNANVDLFFDQLNSNGETFQRQVVTDNNTILLFSNSGGLANGEDRNGNGLLDPGEDINGDGVLNLGSVRDSLLGANADGIVLERGLKFKLNAVAKGKPAKRQVSPGPGERQTLTGKGASEENRANRRKQSVDQLGDLNTTVTNEKLAQQQSQQQSQQPSQQLANTQPQSRELGSVNGPGTANVSGGQQGGQGLPQGGAANGAFGFNTRRPSRPGMNSAGSGQQGGGGFGGGGGGGGFFQPPGAGESRAQQPASQTTLGLNYIGHSGFMPSDGAVQFSGVANQQSLTERWEDSGATNVWSQAGGLSLPIVIQREGNVLQFSRASGSPRLALTVRPNESDKLGLGLVWSAIWIAIAVWLLCLIRGCSSCSTCRQVTVGLSVLGSLGLLGMFFLPSPLSELCFLMFTLAAIALAIGLLRRRRQNAMTS